MHIKAFGLIVALAFLAPPPAHGQETEASSPVLVILPIKGQRAPNLKGPIRKFVEVPLKKQKIKVLPWARYLAAARKAKIKRRDALQPELAVTVAKAAGATHVLVIESLAEMVVDESGKRPRKKKKVTASVQLIAVASGETIYTKQLDLQGPRLKAEVVEPLVEDVVAQLTAPAEAPPAPEPIAEAPSEAPPSDETKETTPVEGEPSLAVTEPTGELSTPPSTEDVPLEAIVAPPPTEPEAPPAVAVAPVPSRSGKWRPALQAGGGGMFLQRDARIKTNGFGPIEQAGPLAGGTLRVSFFPLALGGTGEVVEGLGLELDLAYLYAKTEIEPGVELTSGVLSARGALCFRIVFWDDAVAPDVTLRAGYGAFVFPLGDGPFPGTRYYAPYVGGQFTIPFVPEVAALVGGDYSPMVTTSGRLRQLGDKAKAYGFRAEAGLRLFFDPFEIVLKGRYEQNKSAYEGETSLESTVLQYQNVSLTDRLYGGSATVGVAF